MTTAATTASVGLRPPSEKDQLFSERLDEMVQNAMKVTQDWKQLWEDGFDYLFGNQLRRQERREGWDRIQANYIFPAAMQELSLLSQRRPQIVAEPIEGSDTEVAEAWTGILQWQFAKGLDMEKRLAEALLDNKVYGYCVAKVFWDPQADWDPEARRYRGAVRVNIIQPDYFGMDPEAESAEEASYVVLRWRMPLDQAKARWPKFANELDYAAKREYSEPAGSGSFFVSRDDQQDSGPFRDPREGRLVNLLRKRYQPSLGEKKTGIPRPTHVTIEEIYFRDYTERRIVEERGLTASEMIESGAAVMHGSMVLDAKTGKPIPPDQWPRRRREVGREPMYPFGRMVMRVGKTILNPRPAEQRWPYRHWPFVIGVNYVLPHAWQGLNAVEMPRGLQDWLNVSLSHMLNYVKYFGDPVVMVETGALAEDPQNRRVAARLRSRAGAIWKLAKGAIGRIRRDPPPPMSRGILEFFETIGRELRDQTGIQEIGMGRPAKGGLTATEAVRLETNTRLRTALQARLMDQFILNVMYRVAEILQDRLEPEEGVRILGPQNRQGLLQITEKIKKARFDVKLEVATTLPYDRERSKQDYLTLAQVLGVPAVLPELLKAFDIPNANEVMQRVTAWQQLQEFQRQQEARERAGRAAEITERGLQFAVTKRMLQSDQRASAGSEGEAPVELSEIIAGQAAQQLNESLSGD